MGIGKEIERLQAEKRSKEEIIEQERLCVVGKINERVDFLDEQARIKIYPYFQALKQSGAIDILRELKEEAGIHDEIEFGASVSFPNKGWERGCSRSEIRRRRKGPKRVSEFWEYGETGESYIEPGHDDWRGGRIL